MANISYWSHFSQESDRLIATLKQSRIVVCDTDTVAGLLGNVTTQAFTALGAIKEREKKPYLLLVGSKEKLLYFVDQSDLDKIQIVIEQCWPGPLTLIFKAKSGVPAFLLSAEGTIAVRIPKHAGLLDVLTHFDALFSTSANKSGAPTPESVFAIDSSILAHVDMVIANDTVEGLVAVPSTILDCSGDVVRVVREGAFSILELEKLMQIRFDKF